MSIVVDVNALASRLEPGMRLGLCADYGGVPMTALLEAVGQRRARDLHVVCVPTGGMHVDILIGAAMVATLETSAVSLGEAGSAPRFVAGVRERQFRLLDATCPAILTGLLAAQKGVPFIPMRGLIGSDLLAHRPDWKVIDNPFAAEDASSASACVPGLGDPIVLIPAIELDVAMFHVPVADREGNVWIGRRRELAAMAYAARRTLVTAEKLSETSLLDDETVAAGVLPALYVDAVAHAPAGAAPYGLWGFVAPDPQALADYAQAARTAAGFNRWLEARLAGGGSAQRSDAALPA